MPGIEFYDRPVERSQSLGREPESLIQSARWEFEQSTRSVIDHEPESQVYLATCRVLHQSTRSVIDHEPERYVPESTPFAPEPLSVRLVEAGLSVEIDAGHAELDGYGEAVGLLVDVGSLLADAFKLSAKLGIPMGAEIILTSIMALADASGYTGQSAIVEIESRKMALESRREYAIGDAKELGKAVLAATPHDRSLLRKQYALSRVLVEIPGLEKGLSLVGVERTKALDDMISANGHVGNSKGARDSAGRSYMKEIR